MHTWEIRNPDGGAAGLEFARSRIDPADVVIAHALPSRVDVEVRGQDGAVVARGTDLSAEGDTPMSRLRVNAGKITRENIWPGKDDLGTTVILCGGEAAKLTSWWNAPDHSEWRWSIELYNHR